MDVLQFVRCISGKFTQGLVEKKQLPGKVDLEVSFLDIVEDPSVSITVFTKNSLGDFTLADFVG